MKPRVLFLPHGNLQYSQLRPERRAWVVANAYGNLFDLVHRQDFPMAFEASGFTVDAIARLAPHVMEKLRDLIKARLLEPVASPYTHIMLSNIDPEIGLASLRDGLEAWERCAGVRPTVGWNPECSWADYIPEIYKAAGFDTLVIDGDSLLLSLPEVRQATGLRYDVRGHSNKGRLFRIEDFIGGRPEYERFLTNPSRAANGLGLLCRTDMLANPMLWYLMGATEGVRERPISLDEIRGILERWKDRVARTGTFIMPFAEDAEYIGTSAYFYVKQFGHSRFFEPEPGSVTRFQELLETTRAMGFEPATPSTVLADARIVLDNPFIDRLDNGIAWHGGTAKAWANTSYARLLDPPCRMLFENFKRILGHLNLTTETADGSLRQALRAITSAYVSDARWPPAPTSPGRFNVEEAVADLFAANEVLARGMAEHGVADLKSMHSVELMRTQIEAVRDELAAMPYFGEPPLKT